MGNHWCVSVSLDITMNTKGVWILILSVLTLQVSIVTGATIGKKVVWPLKTSPVAGYRFTTVFGVGIFAESSISVAKFQHIASVFAEWMDNDGDGCVDNPLVLTKLLQNPPRSVPVALKDQSSNPWDAFAKAGWKPSVVMYDDEILPNCAGTKATDACADASLEEILHLITAEGFQYAWPKVFSEAPNSKSKLTVAMDKARGGKFLTIPTKYPSTAWYSYYDVTCTYGCMATEYIYWGVAAYVGALAGRKQEIVEEWKYSTRAELLAGDKLLSAIIQDTSTYRLPSKSPTGIYRGAKTCATGANHGGA